MDKKFAIAIDGPAGAGKSTIAKKLAHKLGIVYIDTGAMYRAVALDMIRKGINLEDKDKVGQAINEVKISIRLTEDGQKIFILDENVNSLIRTPEVSRASSVVAAVPEVRIKMVEIQREIAKNNCVVMDGRDIGTYVLPEAQLKIFLTASVEERAKRRFNELVEKGEKNITLKKVEEDILVRDKNDSTRSFAPLKAADDAKVIDTTKLTIDDIITLIMTELTKLK